MRAADPGSILTTNEDPVTKRLAVAALLLMTALPARAGAELVLEDGRVLEGTGVERSKDDVYLLTQDDGTAITVPVILVKKLHLTGGEEPGPTGFKVAVPKNLVGPPEPYEPPTTRDLLAGFGRPPARFRTAPLDPVWHPVSVLGPDVTEFSPVRWAKAPTNVFWTPKSAFKVTDDVTEFSPAKWRAPLLDPTWRPKNGFRPATKWFE